MVKGQIIRIKKKEPILYITTKIPKGWRRREIDQGGYYVGSEWCRHLTEIKKYAKERNHPILQEIEYNEKKTIWILTFVFVTDRHKQFKKY